MPSLPGVSEGLDRTDRPYGFPGIMLRLIVPPIDAESNRFKRQSNAEAALDPLFSLRWEFSIGDVNAICVKQPIPHVLGFTKPGLRQFGGMHSAWRLDLDRTLADFSFMPFFTEHILHESSNIACHARLPSQVTAAIQPPSFQSIACEALRFDARQTLTN
jgi:hypothetical protein